VQLDSTENNGTQRPFQPVQPHLWGCHLGLYRMLYSLYRKPWFSPVRNPRLDSLRLRDSMWMRKMVWDLRRSANRTSQRHPDWLTPSPSHEIYQFTLNAIHENPALVLEQFICWPLVGILNHRILRGRDQKHTKVRSSSGCGWEHELLPQTTWICCTKTWMLRNRDDSW